MSISTACFVIGGLLVLGAFFSGMLTGEGIFYTAILAGLIILIVGFFISRKKRREIVESNERINNSDGKSVESDYKKTKLSIKKKVGIGVGILFGIMIILGIIGSSYVPDVDEQGNILTESIPLGEKYHPAHTLDTIVVDDIAYKVTGWHETHKLGDVFDSEAADGVFIVVELEMENRGTESVELSSNYFKLIDPQGREFETDNGAWIYLENSIFLKQLQPSLPTKGQIIFDVPNTIESYTLEISEISGYGKKYILL